MNTDKSWYHRHEKLVNWLTLLTVFCGSVFHYFLVDRPAVRALADSQKLTQQLITESSKNQKLLDQRLIEAQANTETLVATRGQIGVQSQLAEANIEQLNNPTKKASDRLTLEQQRVDQVRAIDELIESLRPNMQIKLLPKALWKDSVVVLDFTITNAGTRPIVVDPPAISVTMNSHIDLSKAKSNSLPLSSDTSIEICGGGFINPGEVFPCAAHFRVKTSTVGIGSLTYFASFASHTELPKESRTHKMIASAYPTMYIESKLKKSVTIAGDILR